MEAPDGMLVEIVRQCAHGQPGERRIISYSTAKDLIARGLAKDVVEREVTNIEPVAPVKVTAICPTFNRRRYLPTSIALFLAQTLTNSELLIVDDSLESVADLVPKHPRIRYVRLEKSTRPEIHGHDGRMLIGAKRNVCCQLAKGEFIVHWDDDDWQAPGRMADQVEQLVKFNKQVLTYCNILYWNEKTQMACRCFPRKELRALHGATFCYRKAWWNTHKFIETGGGEDTAYGLEALRFNQLLITDAGKLMVVRAHGHDDTSIVDRGNTCRTADHMGTGAIPRTRKEEIPPEFFAPLLEGKLPDEENGPAPMVQVPDVPQQDAVIGAIKNYDWTKIRAYAVSLSRTGFNGAKLMFVENVPQEVRLNLTNLGFTLVDFSTPPNIFSLEQRDYLTFGRFRFRPVITYLKSNPGRFRNIVWTDVRDLVFQTDPSAWLQKNLHPSRLVAAGEGWLVKDEGYNDRWTRRVSPREYERLKHFDICCSGSFAGAVETMLGVFERINQMAQAATGVPDFADQAMFNAVIRNSPYAEVTRVPLMREGFAATWFPAKSNDPLIIPGYGKPIFNAVDGVVYTPETNEPFCMVHQYDRDPSWRAIMERKYQ